MTAKGTSKKEKKDYQDDFDGKVHTMTKKICF